MVGKGGVQGFPKFIIYCINEEGSCLISKLKLNWYLYEFVCGISFVLPYHKSSLLKRVASQATAQTKLSSGKTRWRTREIVSNFLIHIKYVFVILKKQPLLQPLLYGVILFSHRNAMIILMIYFFLLQWNHSMKLFTSAVTSVSLFLVIIWRLQTVDDNSCKLNQTVWSFILYCRKLVYSHLRHWILNIVGIMTKSIVHHSCQKWLYDPRSFLLNFSSYQKASLLHLMMKNTTPIQGQAFSRE